MSHKFMRKKPLLLGLAVLVLGLGLFFASAPSTSAINDTGSPTIADLKACRTKYAGTYAANSTKYKNFTKSNCYDGNGGNCSAKKSGKNEKVTCTVPANTDSSGSGNSGSGGAQSNDPAMDYSNSPCQDAGHCNITTKYINPIINKFLAPLAMLAVVAGLVWGGIMYTTAGGDPQQTADAKGKIQKALIGLVAFLFLYAFLQWLLPGGLI